MSQTSSTEELDTLLDELLENRDIGLPVGEIINKIRNLISQSQIDVLEEILEMEDVETEEQGTWFVASSDINSKIEQLKETITKQ